MTHWVGFAAAACTTLAFLPQAWRVIRRRQTADLSLSMYTIFTLGVALWLAYGWILGDWPIILANAITLILSATILALKLRWG